MSQTPEHHRRDFLKGRSAAAALGKTIDDLLPPEERIGPGDPTAPETIAGSGEAFLVSHARRAMACEFEALVNAGQYPQAGAAAVRALDVVDSLEAQLSVYRDTSEISDLNRSAFHEPVPVAEEFFELLVECRRLYDETEGAFDITAGPLVRLWGFLQRKGRIPEPGELATALATVGSDGLELDPARRTVRFLREGMELNLGSIGKGYALDRAAAVLRGAGVNDFFLHGGQSSVLAMGRRLDASAGSGWRVGVKHPLRPGQRIAEVRLMDQALGTSGSGTQFFRVGDKKFGHILDPRSGRPAEGVLQSTVVAPRAALADALATAFYVGGVEASLRWCEHHPEIAVLLVTPGPRSGEVMLHSAGFNDTTLIME